jgi:tRNA (mo5U34)-methyltransferase
MVEKDIALKLITGRKWFHDYEIIPGVRTFGSYTPADLWTELQLPDDLSGLSLADVGASNGYFSFEARRRGARVVAFDYRHKDNSGFGLAQYINGLHDIEHHHLNVLDVTRERFGEFDIVLALGLFYHTPDPYRALLNCAGLCKELLFIESYCIDFSLPRRMAKESIVRFLPDPLRFPGQKQPNDDRSNFWGFSSKCLQCMVDDVGFTVTHTRVREDRALICSVRSGIEEKDLRVQIGYGYHPVIPVGKNPEEPESWTDVY